MIDAIPDWIIWVLLIFAAGVVGQFGKALTTRFLDSFKAEETKETEKPAEPIAKVEGANANLEPKLTVKEQKKIEKAEAKRAKKEAKAQTKAGD